MMNTGLLIAGVCITVAILVMALEVICQYQATRRCKHSIENRVHTAIFTPDGKMHAGWRCLNCGRRFY